MAAAKKTTSKGKSHKGKRHPAHAASFKRIAEALQARAATGAAITAQECLNAIAEAFMAETKTLRRIVR